MAAANSSGLVGAQTVDTAGLGHLHRVDRPEVPSMDEVVVQSTARTAFNMQLLTVSAFGLSRLIESLLFGVTARDPLVCVAVPAVLSVVALIAVWLPALRATRIDPIDALRYE